jgi:uncharacterized protein
VPNGEPGLKYLCAGYKRCFKHIDHPRRLTADLLRRGRYADEVMGIVAKENTNKTQKEIWRSILSLEAQRPDKSGR